MIGIINLCKPPGISSNHALMGLRRITKQKYSGHAGTLDPEAAGVLPILMGRASRLFDYLPDYKEYIAEVTFGFTTDTLDCEGKIIEQSDVIPDKEELINVLSEFVGEITQIPPAYSAIKQNGVPLYKLARKGIEINIPSRKVNINSITYLESTGSNSHLIQISCSKGTYIRTLCADIGHALGACATMTFLLRSASGNMRIEDSITINEIESAINRNDIEGFLKPPDFAVSHLPQIELDDMYLHKLANGNRIAFNSIDLQVTRMYCAHHFLGLAMIKDNIIIPKVLLITSEELK